jgi:hypothetical protein
VGVSIQFEGMNREYITPPENLAEDGPDNGKPNMWGFNNGVISYTRWKLSPEEIAEIVRSGEVWMAARVGTRAMQPHWVGSLSFIKRACADFGKMWNPGRKPQMLPAPAHRPQLPRPPLEPA